MAVMKPPAWLAALVLVSTGYAQTPPSEPPPESRQFDFWIGEWEVFSPDGRKTGENRIEQMAGGWGLLENWTGAGGYTGKSLNTWMADKKQWQQFWIGLGGALELAGGLNESGERVLSGQTIGPDGQMARQRITWTPNPDGTVRQHWEQSAADGKSWTTAFDGLYRKKVKQDLEKKRASQATP